MHRIPRSTAARAALLAAALGLAGPAAGEPTVPLSTLVAAASAWVAGELALPDAAPPGIAFTERRRLAAMRYPEAAPHRSPVAVEALYDPAARVIQLPLGWRGATPAEVSVLVHELVHHLQEASGWRPACPAERERDAYALQDRWLRRFGGSLERDFGIAPIFVLAASVCSP